MQRAEIELKFPVASLPDLERRLHALGFRLDTPRTFAANTLHDTPDRDLRERGELLRVRQYGDKFTVTHKRHPDHEQPGTLYKVRIETESEVEDGPALAEIFTRLGFGPSFRYEKYRSEWSDPARQGACMVVDETPIGIFAELEGPPDWIYRRLDDLGVNPDDCTSESYGRLFLLWKKRTGSPADHLTFEEVEAATAVR
jgi:adenylate cyclase class 2